VCTHTKENISQLNLEVHDETQEEEKGNKIWGKLFRTCLNLHMYCCSLPKFLVKHSYSNLWSTAIIKDSFDGGSNVVANKLFQLGSSRKVFEIPLHNRENPSLSMKKVFNQ
jgi:hypothetical protein